MMDYECLNYDLIDFMMDYDEIRTMILWLHDGLWWNTNYDL